MTAQRLHLSDTTCPTCGGTLHGGTMASLQAAPLSRKRRAMVNALLQRGELTAEGLARIVYANDPNGGPLAVNQAICTAIWHINRILKPYGWHIQGWAKRGSGNYRLERLGQP